MPTPTYSDAQIREAVDALIKYKDPTSIVYPWFSLEGKPDTWPGQLTSPDDLVNGIPRVHGYVFTRSESGAEEEWRYADCPKDFYEYEVWAYYGYSTGRKPTNDEVTAGTMTNSDLLFNERLDDIKNAINDLRTVELTVPLAFTRLHRRIRPFAWSINLRPFGSEVLHFAAGKLLIDPR
jgi:hypothetical protein